MLDSVAGFVIERPQPCCQEILAYIRTAHAEGAEYTGKSRHIDRRAAQRARDRHCMKSACAAAGDEGEMPGVVTPLDADAFDRMLKALLQQADDPGCRGDDIDPESRADLVFDCQMCLCRIEFYQAVGEGAAAHPAQNELSVGNGRILAAEAIAGGTRSRPGAVRTDVQQIAGINGCNRAASAANGMYV